MAVVPYHGNRPAPNDGNNDASVNNYFMQLLQENREVNVFVNSPALEQGAEAHAASHTAILGQIYNRTSVQIRADEKHADAVYQHSVSLIRQNTEVLVAQLDRELSMQRNECM